MQKSLVWFEMENRRIGETENHAINQVRRFAVSPIHRFLVLFIILGEYEMRHLRRIIPAVLLLALLGYFGWGLHLHRYSPARSGAYLWGAYHVHSTLSDGLADPREIAAIARRTGLSFVILTDHGNPNPRSALLQEEIGGVAILGGSESALPEGHLISFGQRTCPRFLLPPFPPQAVADIREWDGTAVVGYPDHPRLGWKYWGEDLRPDGIEVFNLSAEIKKLSAVEKIRLIASYPFTDFDLLRLLRPPRAALGRWDNLLRQGPVSGFFALNAHGGVRLADALTLPAPAYRTVFRLMAIGVDPRFRHNLREALRQGRFFCVIRGAGEPERFQFESRPGDLRPLPGTVSPARPILEARVEAHGQPVRLDLFRDGRLAGQSRTGRLTYGPAGPGAYRVEAHLLDHPLLRPEVPWIVSNPILIPATDAPPGATGGASGPPPDRQALSPDGFHVETDDRSSARFDRGAAGDVFRFRLAGRKPGDGQRWCSLALRLPTDLRPFRGFYLTADSDTYLRYLVELRAGDRWYYASFKVYPGRTNQCRVPFADFYRVNGLRERMPLSIADSLFISINSYMARPGFAASLTVRETGFYR